MSQLPCGSNKYSSIPKPNIKKANNEIHKATSSNEEDKIEKNNMKDQYNILKMEFLKLQNQFKLYKLEMMTQINKINYNLDNKISALNKEKEEIQIKNDKIILELSAKIDKITLQNQALEKNCLNLNNELQKIQAKNIYLGEMINNPDIKDSQSEKNQVETNNHDYSTLKQSNEKNNQKSESKQNDAFHYQPQENKKNHDNLYQIRDGKESLNSQQNHKISTILPSCIQNNSNANFPVFRPKENTSYLFFSEKTQPNYSKSLKSDVIYGAHDATDIQRFHYYPESQKIFTFIGFANEEIRKNWISTLTMKNISFDRLIYEYPYHMPVHNSDN